MLLVDLKQGFITNSSTEEWNWMQWTVSTQISHVEFRNIDKFGVDKTGLSQVEWISV